VTSNSSERHAGLNDPAPHHDAGGIQDTWIPGSRWIPGQARNGNSDDLAPK